MEINKTNLMAFRKDFAEAVLKLEEKYGLDIKMTSIKFTETNFTAKVEAASTSREAAVVKVANLDAIAKMYCIPFNGSFAATKYRSYNGKTFIPTNIKPSNHKYPIIATCVEDGKSYKLSVEQLRTAVIV